MLEKKKLEEAHEHVRLAEKYLKTSPLKLKFNPDWDPAGDEFSRAATAFKVAKDYEQSKKCLLRAVDCYKEVHSIFQAGKMLEQAVLVSRDMGQMEDIASLAERGALMYRQVNKPESASSLLEKAAKMIEKDRPEDATGLYEKAAETVSTEDRPNVSADFVSKASRLHVRTCNWDKAIHDLRQEIAYRQEAGTQPSQAAVGLVLIELMREDLVAAEKVFKEFGGYMEGGQLRAVTNAIAGFNDHDYNVVNDALNSTAIRELDLDFAKLAREIPRPKQKTGDDDDDMGGGLC